MALWKRAMEERVPIPSARMLFRYSSSPMLINERDATKAFNIIIQKQSGLFTPEELAQINAGLHIREMNERFNRYKYSNIFKSPDDRTDFFRSYINVFIYAILFSPNLDATDQLYNDFKQHVDYAGFEKEIPYETCAISELLNSSRKWNIHCSAYEKGPISYMQRMFIGLWRTIDFITGRKGS